MNPNNPCDCNPLIHFVCRACIVAERDALRAKVDVYRGALGNIPLIHDGECALVVTKDNPLGTWSCIPECTDRIIREALRQGEDINADND